MTKRFHTLRFFAGVHIVCGALLIASALCILFVIFGTDTASPEIRTLLNTPVALFSAIVLVIVLVMAGVGWIAFGQLLQVFMQIEENTRRDEDAVGQPETIQRTLLP